MTPTIGEFVEWVPPDELREGLKKNADRYLLFLEEITAKVPRSERNLAIFNIARAAGVQVERLHLLLDQGADLLALCARNLFELDLVLRFVLVSDQNLRSWLGQLPQDEHEFLEALIDAAPSETESTAELRRRITQVERMTARHGLRLEGHLSVSKLARITGLEAEYKAMFKLLSKHVHPSSYLVNGDSHAIHSWYSINIFLTFAQLYAADIEQRVRAETGLLG
jgi:hypothetical protein